MDVTHPTPIRVLIVDDHPLVRRGLTSLLNGTTDIQVVGAASDGEEAVAYAVEEHPDIVLMDISMPGMNGFEALRRMLKAVAGTKVVMLTSYSEHDMVVEAIDNGAVGFLLKDTEPQELLNGIRSAAKGDTPLSPKAAKELLRDRVKRRPLDDLTQRELDVLTLVGRGMSNKQIAWRLGISEKTVKAHLGSVFARLGVEDRATDIRRISVTDDVRIEIRKETRDPGGVLVGQPPDERVPELRRLFVGQLLDLGHLRSPR